MTIRRNFYGRLPPGHFEQLLKSGEIHRLARDCVSQAELARKMGMTPKAFSSARDGLKLRGVIVPSFDELRGGDPGVEIDVSDFETEERTQPTTNLVDTSNSLVDPPLEPLPDGHRVRGLSTYVGPDGEIKGQWIKTTAVNDERTAWLDAIRDMGGELPHVDPVAPPQLNDADLLAVYPVGDPHVGMKAWHEDAGENFDMVIAERNLVAAFKHLIDLAPPAAMALLIFIGDNTHVDGQSNTTTSGTRQDADSRTVKMARTIIRICRRAIDLALVKHGRVRMIVERGNHDELISAMVALALSLAYEDEPRVEIDVSPELYHWFRFGAVLIGTHHGDRAKPMDLLGVMAVDRADDWSETKHRRFYCGHVHHQIVKEVPGMIVEYLPTLAGSDAWHRGMGYRSQRAMYVDVFHREHGHINRHIVGIDQLRRSA